MYHRCDMGMAGRVWPDGRALLDQPHVLIQAFDVIGKALRDFAPSKDKKRASR